MSRVLLHHLCPPFLVQFLLGTPLCVVQFQHNLGILWYVRTNPKCFVASTTFSHICRLPTHPFVGLLVPAACSLQSHSTDCQHTDSRICKSQALSPSRRLTHRVFIALVGVNSRKHRCGQACRQKLLSCSPWHEDYDMAFSHVLSLESCLQPLHCSEPSSPSAHVQVQFLSCISLNRQICSFSTPQARFRAFWRCSHNQSCRLTPFDQSVRHIKSSWLLVTL